MVRRARERHDRGSASRARARSADVARPRAGAKDPGTSHIGHGPPLLSDDCGAAVLPLAPLSKLVSRYSLASEGGVVEARPRGPSRGRYDTRRGMRKASAMRMANRTPITSASTLI